MGLDEDCGTGRLTVAASEMGRLCGSMLWKSIHRLFVSSASQRWVLALASLQSDLTVHLKPAADSITPPTAGRGILNGRPSGAARPRDTALRPNRRAAAETATRDACVPQRPPSGRPHAAPHNRRPQRWARTKT